jgi:hypothetical protein
MWLSGHSATARWYSLIATASCFWAYARVAAFERATDEVWSAESVPVGARLAIAGGGTSGRGRGATSAGSAGGAGLPRSSARYTTRPSELPAVQRAQREVAGDHDEAATASRGTAGHPRAVSAGAASSLFGGRGTSTTHSELGRRVLVGAEVEFRLLAQRRIDIDPRSDDRDRSPGAPIAETQSDPRCSP